MRAKSLVLLMLALGCGLVAAVGINQVMAKRNAVGPPVSGDTRAIFVAMEDIPAGDILSPQVVKLEPWPKDKIPKDAVAKLEDIEGRRAKTKIYGGDTIRATRLFAKGEGGRVPTEMIPKGFRVCAVKVDSVSAGGSLIRPGDRVDVLVHLAKSSERNIPHTTTRTILQDVKVFAVNDVVEVDPGDEKDEKSIAAKTISLLLTPDQAEKVTLATNLGMIRLVLRSYSDDTQTDLDGAEPGELFGLSDKSDRSKEDHDKKPGAQQPSALSDWLESLAKKPPETKPVAVEKPAPQPPSTWKVRILEGGQVSEVTLETEPEAAANANGFMGWTVGADGAKGKAVWDSPQAPPAAGADTSQPGAPTPAPEPSAPDQLQMEGDTN